MPLIATALAFVLRAASIFLVVRTLLALGLGVTVFVGGLQLVDAAEQALLTSFGNLPAAVAQLMRILALDYAIAVIFGAYSFRFTYGLAGRFGPRLPEGTPGVTN